MMGRDRIVLIGLIVVAALGAAWMLVVSPARKEASKLNAQVSEAQTQLSSAQSELASARAAESQYPTAYASIVSLGKAVPASEEVPSLIYQLTQASNRKNVDFSSIVSGEGSASSAAAAAPAAAGATVAAGFTQMPFTFIFNGGFFDLEHLFQQLTSFTNHTSSGELQVRGRLLTIQSVKLSPMSASGAAGGGTQGGSANKLTGTITAAAYVLPAGQGLTAGATATSPTGAASTPAPAASTSGAAAPAIARVTP